MDYSSPFYNRSSTYVTSISIFAWHCYWGQMTVLLKVVHYIFLSTCFRDKFPNGIIYMTPSLFQKWVGPSWYISENCPFNKAVGSWSSRLYWGGFFVIKNAWAANLGDKSCMKVTATLLDRKFSCHHDRSIFPHIQWNHHHRLLYRKVVCHQHHDHHNLWW